MPDPPGSAHLVTVYDSPDAFVEVVADFLLDGLARGDRLLAAVRPDRYAWLADALGPEADAIGFLDARTAYRPQAAVIATAFAYLEAEPGRPARVVAEQALAERSPAEVRDYLCLEAAVNLVFAGSPISLLCPYDLGALADPVLAESVRVHPHALTARGPRPNASFADPRAYLAGKRPAPAPAGAATLAVGSTGELGTARAFVAARAAESGLDQDRTAAATTAVVEVLTNALVHGLPPVSLQAYVEDGALVHHVRDAGPGPLDPLAGWLPPALEARGGRGLWIARQCCDALEVAADATGSHVRIHTLLDRGGPAA